MSKKIAYRIITFFLLTIFIREIIRLFSGDFSSSTIPGWHISIEWNEWILTIAAIVVVLLSLIVSKIFQHIYESINRFFARNK